MKKLMLLSKSTNEVRSKDRAGSEVRFCITEVSRDDEILLRQIFTSQNYSFNLWSECKLGEVGNCNTTNYRGVVGVILDIDEGYSLDQARQEFADYIHIIHTSTSHQVEKGDKLACDRFRILLPFDPESVPRFTDLSDGSALYDYLKQLFPFADPMPMNPAGKFFPFLGNDPNNFHLEVNSDGEWFDVDSAELESFKSTQPQQNSTLTVGADPCHTQEYDRVYEYDVEDWIGRYSSVLSEFGISKGKPWQLSDGDVGRRWTMQTCPWDPTHTNGSAYIAQFPNGNVVAGCHHNSCTSFDENGHKINKWASLLQIMGLNQDFKQTDMGNSERLIHLFGDELLYSFAAKSWYAYDGTRWKIDRLGRIERLAMRTVRSIYAESLMASSQQIRKALASWAMQSESRSRVKHMIEGARAGLAVSIEEFDQDEWLLNVVNGTLDLNTGQLLPHDRDNLITKKASVEWLGLNEQLPEWDAFLDQVTGGDIDLQKFLQVAVGYTLTGSTAEEKFFFVHGPAASGKSTFMEAVRMILGDYAKTADFETFLKRKDTGNARPDIARLVGARLVSAIELDEGKRFAEGMMKSITGGDMITARHLYQESFEFKPMLKLWLVANHAPDIDSGDDGMWRRVLRVPFEHIVPENQRDPSVKAQLIDPGIAGPAILAWAVRGCLEWQQNGLQVPQSVEEATQEYRDEMNPFEDFFTDECEFSDQHSVASKSIYDNYKEWAIENRYMPSGMNKFSDALKAKGCQKAVMRIGGKQLRGWKGVRLQLPF